MSPHTAYRTCPLCEATCGLAISLDGGAVTAIRGDHEDVFSHGFICPKGPGLKDLHEDPDRVRTPLIKRHGEFQPASWDEAFAEVDRRLSPILEKGGRNAAAAYLGNPSAHNVEAMIYTRVFLKALDSGNVFTASTVDQMPKHVSAGLMFGTSTSIPIPDLDRTDYLLMLGANPLASNGSLLTAPDVRGRLRRIRERGGKVVVIDPRRTRTAEQASAHHFIRPGTDALLLAAIANVLFAEGFVSLGTLEPLTEGLEQVRDVVEPFTPEAVESACAVAAKDIRTIARELTAAPTAAVYGRIGTCTQEFGTLASWLVDVLNVLTGNLDRPGGAMFTKVAAGASNTRGAPGRGRGFRLGQRHSRVRGAASVIGELPVVCLAEEIDTPGPGQVRALFTIAGNPAVSVPNSDRLRAAFDQLELMVCVDVYVNETTRHADVILPAPSHLERSHYDLALYQFALRNIANYSAPLLAPDRSMQAEWRTLLRLAGIAAGQGPSADIDAMDDVVIAAMIQQECSDPASSLTGRDGDELLSELAQRRGPERVLDLMLRAGPYGDRFGANPDGLTLAKLEAAPHGVDFGPLESRLPEVLRTQSGKIELAPEPIVADVERLRASLNARRNGGMVLIGRRHLRSNNSWMHNVPHLVRGPDRCTVQVHPDDAARLGLTNGELAYVKAKSGEISLGVETTDSIMSGVVSIPHGWGHDAPGVRLTTASRHAGANSNVLADDERVDRPSGNAVLNGIPVELRPA